MDRPEEQPHRGRWAEEPGEAGGAENIPHTHTHCCSASAGYTWSDGTPLSHTNWAPGEPNDHDGREDCVEMVTNGNGSRSSWNDLNCDAHQDWICMIDKGKTPVPPPEPPSPVPGTGPTRPPGPASRRT